MPTGRKTSTQTQYAKVSRSARRPPDIDLYEVPLYNSICYPPFQVLAGDAPLPVQAAHAWMCYLTMAFRDVLHQFSDHTTMHGVPKVINSKSTVARVFWSVVCLAAGAMFGLQMTEVCVCVLCVRVVCACLGCLECVYLEQVVDDITYTRTLSHWGQAIASSRKQSECGRHGLSNILKATVSSVRLQFITNEQVKLISFI